MRVITPDSAAKSTTAAPGHGEFLSSISEFRRPMDSCRSACSLSLVRGCPPTQLSRCLRPEHSLQHCGRWTLAVTKDSPAWDDGPQFLSLYYLRRCAWRRGWGWILGVTIWLGM